MYERILNASKKLQICDIIELKKGGGAAKVSPKKEPDEDASDTKSMSENLHSPLIRQDAIMEYPCNTATKYLPDCFPLRINFFGVYIEIIRLLLPLYCILDACIN